MLKRVFVSLSSAATLVLLVAMPASRAQERGTADRADRGAGTTDRGLVYTGKILRVNVPSREVVLGDVMGPTTGSGGGVSPRERIQSGTGPAGREAGGRGTRSDRNLDRGDTATGSRVGGTAGPVDRTDTG